MIISNYSKYIEYKNDYVNLKTIGKFYGGHYPEGGSDQQISDKEPWLKKFSKMGTSAYQAACNLAIKSTTKISGIASCEDYYNKGNDGKYLSFYEFDNMNDLDQFIDYVFMATNEYNQGTVLYELQMNKRHNHKKPQLINLFMNCKLSKARILELLFSKKDVEKYTQILEGTFEPVTTLDIAVNSFIRTLPQHVTDSLKNILYIDVKNEYTENIWDAYSTVLSFISCLLDSKLLSMAITIPQIKEMVREMGLPINFMFLDLIFDSEMPGCSRNINNLYTKFFEKKQRTKMIIPDSYIESHTKTYNQINEFTLNDFFDKDKNTMCCLPPSVLFMLMIRIDPLINDQNNQWNNKMKNWMSYLEMSCDEKVLAEKQSNLPHLPNSPSHPSNSPPHSPIDSSIPIKQLTEEQQTIEILQNKIKELTEKINKNDCWTKTNSSGPVNKINQFMGSLSLNLNLPLSNKSPQCKDLETLITQRQLVETQLKIVQSQMSISAGSTTQRLLIKSINRLVDLHKIAKAVCENRIQWDTFDGVIGTVTNSPDIIFSLFNVQKNINLTHLIMHFIIGFVIYLPIDLRRFFHVLLRIDNENINNFNSMYDIYKIYLYNDFTSKNDANYYTDDQNSMTKNPLFPPQILLDHIKDISMGLCP